MTDFKPELQDGNEMRLKSSTFIFLITFTLFLEEVSFIVLNHIHSHTAFGCAMC